MSDEKWKVLSTKELLKSSFFCLREDRCELPDKRVMPRYYVMDFPEWVNIVPVTLDKKVLLIRQYRHAAGEHMVEIPGGTTDPKPAADGAVDINDKGVTWGNEDILDAAKRELLEETGYESQNWRYLGYHFPNPALQSNRMHTFLALDCKKVAELNLDPFEEIEVMPVSIEECIEIFQQGKIQHSIVAASLAMALQDLETLNS